MKRRRITRAQSRDQTRERLCESAQMAFVKKGFTAASVEDIVKAAGYTRGAFYSNFRSKPELFLELLRRDHEAMQVGLRAIFEEGATRDEMESRVLEYYSNLHSDRKCFLLWAEAKLLAARDGHFRVNFNAFLREKRERLSAYIQEFSLRAGTPLPMEAELMALGLMGLLDGVRFFHMIDPLRVTGPMAESVLSGFLAQAVFGRKVG